MLIIGRITQDAVVKQLRDERKVVSFSIALNHWYKPKNGEATTATTFVNCSYWIGAGIADRLKKGSIVEVSGHPTVRAYTNMSGDAKATLDCHVDTIRIHQLTGKASIDSQSQAKPGVSVSAEDLPF